MSSGSPDRLHEIMELARSTIGCFSAVGAALIAGICGILVVIYPRLTGPADLKPGLVSKLATATPQVAELPSRWPIVLLEAFDSNSNDWNIASQQPYKSDNAVTRERIGDGKLHLEINATNGVRFRYYPGPIRALSDQYLAVDAKRVSGTANVKYGLFFRMSAEGSRYIFEISDDKHFDVGIYDGGKWTGLIGSTLSDAIRPGEANHLAVIAQGSHFSFLINGQQVGETSDARLLGGLAGLAIDMNTGDEIVLEFSKVELRAPVESPVALVTAPAPSPTLPVASPTKPAPSRTLPAASPTLPNASPTIPAPPRTLGTPAVLATLPFPSPTLLPRDWPIVVSDDFTSNKNAWPIDATQPATGKYGTVNERLGGGVLRLEAKALESFIEWYQPNTPAVANFYLSVGARHTSGALSGAYGVMFRKDTNNSYYLFAVKDDQQFGVWLYQTQWITLIGWSHSNAIQPGAVNQLSVAAQGSHFTCLINSQQVCEVDDGRLTSGRVGVAIELFNPGDEGVFEFSNFELRAP